MLYVEFWLRIGVDIVLCHIYGLRLILNVFLPGNTPLIEGSSTGELDIVKYLVGIKANIEAKDNDGR